VGRGPLAGPVVAAAVILPDNHGLVGLTDSKRLTELARRRWYDVIVSQSVAYGFGIVSPEVIDEINILQATLRAMRMAVAALSQPPGLVKIDGHSDPQLDYPTELVVRGDQTVACISAASIIAKVTRDQMMVDYEKTYPGYGFAQHKGYGTAAHYAAIAAQGITPIHRRSFRLHPKSQKQPEVFSV
jgi:ribonuclease HII